MTYTLLDGVPVSHNAHRIDIDFNAVDDRGEISFTHWDLSEAKLFGIVCAKRSINAELM